ncbi:MAG: hypothetical protein AMXMBFR80_17310 [Dehalococcoidia bacterium]|jgi:xanthosine utilization system XapX-like protein
MGSGSRLKGFGLAGIVVGASIAPLAWQAGAEAKSVRCDEAGNCKVYCTQTLPNGSYVEYEEGTQITITDKDGNEFKFVCKNGQWETAAIVIPAPQWERIKLIGNIGVAGIAGVMGTVTTTVCNDSPEPICEVVSNDAVPPGLGAAP